MHGGRRLAVAATISVALVAACSQSPESRDGFDDTYRGGCWTGVRAASDFAAALKASDTQTLGKALWLWTADLNLFAGSLHEFSETRFDKAGELLWRLDRLGSAASRYAGTVLSDEAKSDDESQLGANAPLPAPEELELAIKSVTDICGTDPNRWT